MVPGGEPLYMVQCEMCGTETAAPKTAKIEGAELQVCEECVEFGTEVTTTGSDDTSSKYSTSASSDEGGGQAAGTAGGSSSGGRSGRSRRDLFDEMETLASDYPERIREAREGRGLSQEELAKELNEKTSQIRKLERGDIQPNDAIQEKLEGYLDISLTEGGAGDDGDWDADISPSTTTLGDVVKRKE